MAWIQTPIPYKLSDVFFALTRDSELAQAPLFWLDSADPTQKGSPRSMLTLALERVAQIDSCGTLRFTRACDDVRPEADLWSRLDAAVERFREREPGCPAGWVSWLSYACGFLGQELLEPVRHPDAISMAEAFEVGAALIEANGQVCLLTRGETAAHAQDLQGVWRSRIASALEEASSKSFATPDPLTTIDRGDKAAYIQAVTTIKRQIDAGALAQVCVTYPIQFERPDSMPAWYAHLRERSPAGYCAFVRASALECASTSPECLFEIEGSTIRTRPMKGTRKRGTLPDAALAQELRTNPKDRAENQMIAEVACEDLRAICHKDSVYVRDAFTVETYATVLQLTSTIEGQLRDDVGPFRAYAALSPPASMTGAPRTKACALLQTLEPHARGLYSGSIAWIDGGDRSQFSVVIRALQAWENHAAWHVGGGIIESSEAEDEWAESRAKAAALDLDADA